MLIFTPLTLVCFFFFYSVLKKVQKYITTQTLNTSTPIYTDTNRAVQ